MTKKKTPEFTLPDPDLDLRALDWMPLNVTLLRDSDLMMRAEPEALRAALLLWCASWHQIPAGSLPNDERVLMALAGLRGDSETWARVRDDALHKFVQREPSGRLFHPVIVGYALTRQAVKTKAKRAAKASHAPHSKRLKTPDIPAVAGSLQVLEACERSAMEKEIEKEKEEVQGFSEPTQIRVQTQTNRSDSDPRERVASEARALLGDDAIGLALSMADFVSPDEVVVAIKQAATKREPLMYFNSALGRVRDRAAAAKGYVAPVKPKPKWSRGL